jgi:type I restriction enzyme S subunit
MTQALPKDVPQTLRRWKRYPDYKNSSVEWLGEIPEHWNAKRLKYVKSQDKNAFVDGPFGSNLKTIHYDVKGEVLVIESEFATRGKFVEDDLKRISRAHFETIKRSEARTGDIIIAKIGANFGLSSILPELEAPAVVSGNSMKLTLNTKLYLNGFIHYHLLQLKYSGAIDLLVATTAQPALSLQGMNTLVLAIPPFPEQQAIASFLDRETAKIDALIAKKERLIELLQEKRTAIISHAVTKGLDPTVPLEDSGVDWLGEVPTHWEVKRIKYLAIGQDCGIQMGPFGGMLKDLSVEETGFKVYGQENTINDDFTAGHRWITYKQLLEMARYTVRKGDLLLTRKGSIGKCRVVPDDVIPGIIDSDTIRVRVNEDWILKSFLVRLMHEAWYLQEQIVWNSRGAILTGLNTTTIAELRVAVPPLSEQKEIVAYLDRETAKIDALIAKIREGIEKLKEYRTALISAAVTGKIDVRNEVAS